MSYTTQFDSLFQKYGTQYGFDPLLLKTIAIKESSLNPNVTDNVNSNGTIDVGLMQINSKDPQYNQFGGYSVLKSNPDASIQAAASTLQDKANMLKSIGQPVNNYNLLKAYNSWSPAGAIYAASGIGIYNQLTGGVDTSPTNSGTVASTGTASNLPTFTTLLAEPSRLFWLVLGAAIIIIGIYTTVNPLANLSNVIEKLGVKK